MNNCLDLIKQKYKENLNPEEMEIVYDLLKKQLEDSLRKGSNIAQVLTSTAEGMISNRERMLKEKQLQNLVTMQAIADSLTTIKFWKSKGIKDPIMKALKAKVGGSPIRIFKGRSSTELKMNTERTKFQRNFANDLDDHLKPLWNSKKFQVEIADAVIKTHRGEVIEDPNFRRIGEIVKKYQNMLIRGQRELGIGISELDDRAAPNIHRQDKLLKLSRAEKKLAKEQGISPYKFAKNKWINFIFSKLDKERTFTKNNIDYKDPEALNKFFDLAFDHLTNGGDVSDRKMSLVKKITQPRVFHWADAQSMIEYNNEYGSGAIQDSIISELTHGFARLPFIRDWGFSPTETMGKLFKVLNEDPDFFERPNKQAEFDKLTNLVGALQRNPNEYGGTWGEFARNLRAFESIAKLGMVAINSIPDLGLLATEASRHNVPGYQAIGEAISNLFGGMSKDEKLALKDIYDTTFQNHIGAISKYAVEGYDASSLTANALRLNFKLNGLEYWDHALRTTTMSIVSRRLAQLKDTAWEDNNNIFELYDIDEADWDMIRQSQGKAAGRKTFITPDGIQELPYDVVREALEKKGGGKNISPMRVEQYKNEVESKLRAYIQDRVEHVILRPGVLDSFMLTLNKGSPQNDAANQAFKLFTQFKLYSVNFARVPLASILYGKGARNFHEATLGGKGDYLGLSIFMSYMMAMKYGSMSINNLVQGLSPPSLDKLDTWKKMMAEGAGIYGMTLDLDPADLMGSIGRTVAGPVLSDITKLGTLGYNFTKDLTVNEDFTKTFKSLDNISKGYVPKYPWSSYVMNNLLMAQWEDYANPGAREKYYTNLEQKHGVERIF